ncbi:MAG: GNAT family N-acetyltransferase [Candidatus Thorarchaeota archaeon]
MYIANIKIILVQWDEQDLDEVSNFIYDNKIGIYKNAVDSEAVREYLSNIQKRFPAEVIFTARKNGELCGWASFDRESETVAELGRWQPIVKRTDSDEEIADLLLTSILDYSKKNGVTRIECMFNSVDSDSEDEYEKSASWFESNGIHKLEDNAYLTLSFENNNIESRNLLTGLSLASLEVVDEQELYHCYYDSFSSGEDRDFLDMNDKQRREKFDKSLHSDTINHELSSVLKDGEKIVGFAFVLTRENEEHVDRFGILGEYRGKGLAKAHLLQVLKSAKEAGTSLMSIGVDLINSSAVNLYKNVGFEVDSRTIVHVWKMT